MNMGAYAGAAMSLRNRTASPRGGVGPPAKAGDLIRAKSLRRKWGPPAVLHAQQGGDGAHEYGRLCRGRDLPAQQGGLSSRWAGPPAEAGDLIRFQIIAAAMGAARGTPRPAVRRWRP